MERPLATHLQLALAAGKIGTWELALPARELTCSHQCKGNFGRGPDQPFSYEDLYAAVHPEDRHLLDVAVQTACRTGREFGLEYRCLWPDESLHWIAVSGLTLFDAEGQPRKLTGITQEITSRKDAEEALRNSRLVLETRVHERTNELSQEVHDRRKAEYELRELSARLLTLKDAEQRRIARELHDSVGQYLAAASMSLGAAARQVPLAAPGHEAITEANTLLQDAIKEVRVVSYLLHPPLLDEMGLVSALQFYLEGFSQRSGIHAQLQVAEDFGRLPMELETALFRVCQECITNVHRHSGSSTATIRLTRFADRVQLEVEDAGRGMPLAKFSGVGLRGLRERIAQFSGTTSIHSGNTGTTVVAELPLVAAPTHSESPVN